MRHFVRFAKLTPNGRLDLGGWRLRIFLTSGEAGAFAQTFVEDAWVVETGFYDDEGDARAGVPRADVPRSPRDVPRAPRFAGGASGRSGGIRTHDPLSPRQVR
jgi:hypothetical protein